jgi:hypothetical protein
LAIVVLGALPLALLTTALLRWHDAGTLAWDFHHELYPQAKLMLSGDDVYPGKEHDPATGTNFVWPAAAAFLVSPLTLASPGVADVAMALAGLALVAAALGIVGVRDWRVYGVVALWPPVFIEPGLSHLTPVIAILTAAAWRWRDSNVRAGVSLGFAIALKLFVWPLGVWLTAIGRRRATLVAALITGASLTLVLPYTSLGAYAAALLRVGRTFDQDTYTIYGFVVQAGLPDAVGRAAAAAVAISLLAAMWRYRSFTLAVAAVLVVSPVVWLDYFALVAIPLAVVRPRLSPVWFVPLATMGLKGAGLAIGDMAGTGRVLTAFAIVLWVAFRAERAPQTVALTPRSRLGAPTPARLGETHRPVHAEE